LCHRDIKSPNIFLTRSLIGGISDEYAAENTIAKLGDFGLSLFLVTEVKQTLGEGVIGDLNPRWAAPEILNGSEYSTQSDIYSLGLLMWEISHHNVVYLQFQNHPLENEKIREHVLNGGRPIISHEDGTFGEIASLCWNSNPFHRPTAYEVYEALRMMAKNEAHPSLFSCLKPLFIVKQSESNHTSLHNYETREWKKSICLPKVEENERSHRVICSVLAGKYLWMACQNRTLIVVDCQDEESTPLFALASLFPQESLINCMTYREDALEVWTGSESGLIQVCFISNF
jgi:serine/threonine protein kinase